MQLNLNEYNIMVNMQLVITNSQNESPYTTTFENSFKRNSLAFLVLFFKILIAEVTKMCPNLENACIRLSRIVDWGYSEADSCKFA